MRAPVERMEKMMLGGLADWRALISWRQETSAPSSPKRATWRRAWVRNVEKSSPSCEAAGFVIHMLGSNVDVELDLLIWQRDIIPRPSSLHSISCISPPAILALLVIEHMLLKDKANSVGFSRPCQRFRAMVCRVDPMMI